MNYSFLSKYSGWENILIVMVSLMLFFMGINESSYISISIRNLFIFSFFSVSVITLAGLSGITGKTTYSISFPAIAMLVWLGFIIMQTIITGKIEQYYLLYYSLSILLFLSTIRIYRTGKFDFKHIYKLFFILAVVEAVVCVLQYSGIVSSHDIYFKVKGTFDNPNTTAMFLTACVPYAVNGILEKKNKRILIVNLVVLLLALVLLNCRTAYIGLIVIFGVYAVRKLNILTLSKRPSRMKYLLIVVITTITLLFTSLFLYESKKASADGRVFIWKVCTQMVAQKPFSGYGYGFFPKEYNLFQAEYFRTHQTTTEEKLHASYVYMPYNDILEQAIQGGLTGAVLYLICMGIILYYSLKRKLITETAIILSFLAMSCTNYGIQAIPLWTLFLLCAASIVSHSEKQQMNIRHKSTNQFYCY